MIIREGSKENIDGAEAVRKIVSAFLASYTVEEREREHFMVFGLNTKNKVKYIDLCSLGTLTSSAISPREVYRLAVLKGCAGVVCAHNHPSGDPAPSREDILITDRLREAGDLLGIKFLDHVIVGEEDHFSMLAHGYISEGGRWK